MDKTVFGKGYAEQYDLLYREKDYDSECEMIEDALRRYGRNDARTVLDLGCGTGNHAIPLTRKGYMVTGVDRSSEMLTLAREKAQALLGTANQYPLSFFQGDLRNLDLNRRFDVVLMMFAVLGYQVTNTDVTKALRTVQRHLEPKGLFLFDVWYGPAVLAQRPSDRVKVIPTKEGRLIRTASGRLDTYRHICEVHYNIWRLNGSQLVEDTEETHLMRYFFPQELALFLELAHLELVGMRSFMDLNREPDADTWNVLVSARPQ